MPDRLPARPHLRNLKNRAKRLLKAHKAGSAGAAADIRAHLEQFGLASDDEIFTAGFTLLDAQLVIARRYGFASWSDLKEYIEAVRQGEGCKR